MHRLRRPRGVVPDGVDTFRGQDTRERRDLILIRPRASEVVPDRAHRRPHLSTDAHTLTFQSTQLPPLSNTSHDDSAAKRPAPKRTRLCVSRRVTPTGPPYSDSAFHGPYLRPLHTTPLYAASLGSRSSTMTVEARQAHAKSAGRAGVGVPPGIRVVSVARRAERETYRRPLQQSDPGRDSPPLPRPAVSTKS